MATHGELDPGADVWRRRTGSHELRCDCTDEAVGVAGENEVLADTSGARSKAPGARKTARNRLDVGSTSQIASPIFLWSPRHRCRPGVDPFAAVDRIHSG
jgi:hypothetical protein